MKDGFYLFIDEAGDEGLERVRPIQSDGASEYFVMSGILVRANRYAQLENSFNLIKEKIGLSVSNEIHFRDLDDENRQIVLGELSKLKFGLICIVSNKRNMLKYRNLRCEAKYFEVVRGRARPLRYNWFYNHLFRYLLERASAECARWSRPAFGEMRPIRIIFSRRKELSYSQIGAYLAKLKVERHDRGYFNNKGRIDWSVVNVFNVESRKHKDEVGLQIADCAASAVFRSLDQAWFGDVRSYMHLLEPRLIRNTATPWDYGFKLLPDNFHGPLSGDQLLNLRRVGYRP